MNINRPEEISLKADDFTAVILIEKEIYNNDNSQLLDVYIAPTIVHLTSKNGEKPTLPIDIGKRDELYTKFNKLTYSIGKLIRLSELINSLLKDSLKRYLSKNSINEIVERNSKCRELKKYDFNKDLSFMQMKQVLSCIIKTDKTLHSLEEFNTVEKRNKFTSDLDNYIYDRDCYVHGTLFFLYPNYTPILKVNPPNKVEHYVSLSEKILWDNVLSYKNIKSVLSKIWTE